MKKQRQYRQRARMQPSPLAREIAA